MPATHPMYVLVTRSKPRLNNPNNPFWDKSPLPGLSKVAQSAGLKVSALREEIDTAMEMVTAKLPVQFTGQAGNKSKRDEYSQ